MPKVQLMKHLATFHAGQSRPNRGNSNVQANQSRFRSNLNSGQVNIGDLATSLVAALQSSNVGNIQEPRKRKADVPVESSNVQSEIAKKKKRFIDYSELCQEHAGLTSCFMERCSVIQDIVSQAAYPGYDKFCDMHLNSNACFSDENGCNAVCDWMNMNGYVTRSQVSEMLQEALKPYQLVKETEKEEKHPCLCHQRLF